MGVSYRFFMGADKTNSLNLRMNVNNLFDTVYISDGNSNRHVDGSTTATYKGIDVRNNVYFGAGRTWNASMKFSF